VLLQQLACRVAVPSSSAASGANSSAIWRKLLKASRARVVATPNNPQTDPANRSISN